jgi:hypothetical protein
MAGRLGIEYISIIYIKKSIYSHTKLNARWFFFASRFGGEKVMYTDFCHATVGTLQVAEASRSVMRAT